MRVTSTGADPSVRAAHRPPNPPPMMMTFGRPFISFRILLHHPLFRAVEATPLPILERPCSWRSLKVHHSPRNRRGLVVLCLRFLSTPAPYLPEPRTPIPPNTR